MFAPESWLEDDDVVETRVREVHYTAGVHLDPLRQDHVVQRVALRLCYCVEPTAERCADVQESLCPVVMSLVMSVVVPVVGPASGREQGGGGSEERCSEHCRTSF